MENFKKLSAEFINSEKLSSKIMGAIIGGSYARGEKTPTSDIDLVLIIKNKYQNHYLQIHSSLKKFKKGHFSVIYQTEKKLRYYLQDPDPSVISFLRNGIIISDTNGKLLEIKKRAQKIKIYTSVNEVEESKRRLKERSEENVRRIKEQIKIGDLVSGTYLLKNIADEIVEKLRMYDGDWLYTQKKSNLKFLNQTKHSAFGKVFLKINTPLTKSKLIKYTNSLQNLVEKIS